MLGRSTRAVSASTHLVKLSTATSCSTPQARWKGLRDTFTRKHRAWKARCPSGSEADDCKEMRWPYFRSLMFLKDEAKVGSTISNTKTCASEKSPTSSIVLGTYDENDDLSQEMEAQYAASESNNTLLQEPSSIVVDDGVHLHSSSIPFDVVSWVSSQDAALTANSSISPSKKRASPKKKSLVDMEIEKVDQQINTCDDECTLFGQIVGKKISLCPKLRRTALMIELLQTLERYEGAE
ncbi:uncharacterized protein LOC119407050 [Rhipicephalus sanguineus]|uniref:uncharacterized protein LOC119407050 n=1 Tax=Rhipicephalus sanguineus TaxID=34632 RepID=UPI0020C38817|nr:uncharacterized protein LOC119407050 [Rhipicephalus sanguineus]